MGERHDDEAVRRAIVTPASSPLVRSRSSGLIRRGLATLHRHDTRTISFPRDKSLGGLYGAVRSDKNSEAHYVQAEGWTFLGEARGDVEVPRALDVQLRIRSSLRLKESSPTHSIYAGWCDLSALRQLNAHDIQSLYLMPSDEDLATRQALRNKSDHYVLFEWVTNDDLSNIRNLIGLLGLAVESYLVNDAAFVHIQSLENIKALSIWSLRFANAQVSLLAPLAQLKYFDLGHLKAIYNQSGQANDFVEQLRALPNLASLYFLLDEKQLGENYEIGSLGRVLLGEARTRSQTIDR